MGGTFLMFVFCLSTTAGNTVTIKSLDGVTDVSVDTTLGIVSQVGGPNSSLPLGGTITLDGCLLNATSVTSKQQNNNVTISSTYNCQGIAGAPTVLVEKTFYPRPHSVGWKTRIGALEQNKHTPFTTPIHVHVAWNQQVKDYWTTWSSGCTPNTGHPTNPSCWVTTGDWSNPLIPKPFPKHLTKYRLGTMFAGTRDRPANDSNFAPIITVFAAAPVDFGVTIGLNLDQFLPDVFTTVNTLFTTELTQYDLGIGFGLGTTFEAFIQAHSGDPRCSLNAMTSEFPEYFHPPTKPDILDEFYGLGAYTWEQKPYNTSRLDTLGFAVNWDLSGTFQPYQGLFLPYVAEWLNLGPINKGLQQYNVTYEMIDNHYKAVQEAGFHSLSYFQLAEWGTKVTFPPKDPKPLGNCGVMGNGQAAACPTPQGSVDWCWQNMMQGVMDRGWHPAEGFVDGYKHEWVDDVLMDPTDKAWQQLTLEQASRHFQKIKHFEGTCFDRVDYQYYYSYKSDDGKSWVPQLNGEHGPAASFRASMNTLYTQILNILHEGNAVGFLNCHPCRADTLKYFDGIFSEGSALNNIGFGGLFRPTVMWTYDLAQDSDTLHTFFQQHLYMKVFPMAPFPLNDHSIRPGSPMIERFYVMYGNLFKLLQGSKWVLLPHVVSSVEGTPNVFNNTKGELLVPVVFLSSKASKTIEVTIRHQSGSELVCEQHNPGGEVEKLPPSKIHGGVANVTAMYHGLPCFLLKCTCQRKVR